LEEGIGVPRDRIRQLDADYKQTRAREAALRLIAVRPRTETELRRRLAARRTGREIVDRVIGDLKREGLVDDRIFARLWVEEKIQKGDCGRLRLRHDLEAKGIDRVVVDEEVKKAYSETKEFELAGALALKRLGRLGNVPARDAKRKVFDYLLRRGFARGVAADTAAAAVNHAARMDRDEDR
jgi:regulatory protein